MCQITLANLKEEKLNKLFFLLSGSTGSSIHNDGWGFVQAGSPFFKCGLQMSSTLNSGELLRDQNTEENNAPLIGHIRQASPSVPVTDENAHPFAMENITFVHNGKLVPVDAKKFVTEEDIEEVDPKDKTKTVKKTIKRSDSLIFFEHFMKIYEESKEKSLQTKFVNSLTDAMNDFHGTFAMVFLVGDVYYVVRGKTKELNIAYLVDEEDKSIGWVINTDKTVLNYSTNLLSNIMSLTESRDLYFTDAKLLESETIYVAEEFGLSKIGTILETAEPAKATYYTTKWEKDGSFSTGTGTASISPTNGGGKTSASKWAEIIYEFMVSHALTLYDINNLILLHCDCSIQEVQEHHIKHFCDKILPELRRCTEKSIRKAYRKDLHGGFPTYKYTKNIAYPWMLTEKNNQLKLLEEITKRVE